MDELTLVGKMACLYLAVGYGSAWAIKAARGQSIAELQTHFATTGIVGFITLQWLV